MSAEVESARREWEEAYRRVQDAARRRDGEPLAELVAIVVDELRRRLGATYELRELADEYRRAERWVRSAVAERAPGAQASPALSLAEGAAFHLYSLGATDYAP